MKSIKKQLLNILKENGRTSDEDIAIMLGISQEEATNEREQLEAEGIIRKYKAIINPDKQDNIPVFAFIDCKVTPSYGVGFDDIAKKIYKYPEVHSVYLVSGGYDLRVVVEGKNLKDVAFFVAEKLAREEGILSVQSSFLLRTYKEDGDIIFEEADDSRLSVSP